MVAGSETPYIHQMKSTRQILVVIVFAQFCCTSLWFAGNGVIEDLIQVFQLPSSALGHLTAAVQFGFISGTLSFALLTIADRFSPSKVFFVSAVLAALFNLAVINGNNGLLSLLVLRFCTGFFLAGIYPVGMKIAADYFDKGLGKSLGFLVGALVLGTALPHLLKGMTQSFSWTYVILTTTMLSIFGGLILVGMVADGPYRKAGQQVDLLAFFKVFKNRNFRSPAFGYFGHMWELYAFWTFVPMMLHTYGELHPTNVLNVPLLSFLIIGIGGVACIMGGYLSSTLGTKRTAFIALLLSGICCLISPLLFTIDSAIVFIGFLFFWGMVVVADSPLFSTLVAQNANPEIKGTALTIVNCIGFAITIVSIQLLNQLKNIVEVRQLFLILFIGPLFGLIALSKKNDNPQLHENTT